MHTIHLLLLRKIFSSLTWFKYRYKSMVSKAIWEKYEIQIGRFWKTHGACFSQISRETIILQYYLIEIYK